MKTKTHLFQERSCSTGNRPLSCNHKAANGGTSVGRRLVRLVARKGNFGQYVPPNNWAQVPHYNPARHSEGSSKRSDPTIATAVRLRVAKSSAQDGALPMKPNLAGRSVRCVPLEKAVPTACTALTTCVVEWLAMQASHTVRGPSVSRKGYNRAGTGSSSYIIVPTRSAGRGFSCPISDASTFNDAWVPRASEQPKHSRRHEARAVTLQCSHPGSKVINVYRS